MHTVGGMPGQSAAARPDDRKRHEDPSHPDPGSRSNRPDRCGIHRHSPSSRSAPQQIPAATTTTTTLLTHPGKILAGNCFQCHGTDGINGTFEGIAGESATELYNELKELQTTTEADEAIMKVHANGYTDEQLRLIADYFSKVPTSVRK